MTPLIFTPKMLTRPPKLQPDATLTQVNPVSDTWYTVLDTARNIRVLSMWCRVGNTTAGTITNMQVRFTIDGIAWEDTISPTAGTDYYVILRIANLTTGIDLSATPNVNRPYLLDGRSVKIEIKTVWTVQTTPLEARVKYAKY